MSLKIGFDLWGTLIQSNPLFTKRKEDLFNIYFPNKSGDECEVIMGSIKHDLNQVIEDSGWQPTKKIVNNLISTRMGVGSDVVDRFMEDYQRLAIIYHPTLLEKNTDILRVLHESEEIYIVSNTMFLYSHTLTIILKKLKIYEFFSDLYFSDEQCYSKPDINICSSRQFDYFVGDNPRTDGVYAKQLDTQFIEIYGSTDKTLKHAFDIITKDR